MSEEDENDARTELCMRLLQFISKELGDHKLATYAQLIKEREETRKAIYELCAHYGDTDYSERMYLPDTINKHLATHLANFEHCVMLGRENFGRSFRNLKPCPYCDMTILIDFDLAEGKVNVSRY